jgi:hypothetical protein
MWKKLSKVVEGGVLPLDRSLLMGDFPLLVRRLRQLELDDRAHEGRVALEDAREDQQLP